MRSKEAKIVSLQKTWVILPLLSNQAKNNPNSHHPKSMPLCGWMRRTNINCIKYKLKTCLTKISVDHSKEDQVESLFQKIKEEHKRLDILVNNAYAAVNYIMENLGTPFWEKDPAYSWDIVNNVGLRNNYICTVFAAR